MEEITYNQLYEKTKTANLELDTTDVMAKQIKIDDHDLPEAYYVTCKNDQKPINIPSTNKWTSEQAAKNQITFVPKSLNEWQEKGEKDMKMKIENLERTLARELETSNKRFATLERQMKFLINKTVPITIRILIERMLYSIRKKENKYDETLVPQLKSYKNYFSSFAHPTINNIEIDTTELAHYLLINFEENQIEKEESYQFADQQNPTKIILNRDFLQMIFDTATNSAVINAADDDMMSSED